VKTNKIILTCFIILFAGCKKNNVSATKKIETIDSVQEKNLVNKDEDIENNNNKSFVISCGSGCAMTYNVKAIEDLEKFKKVKFEVETYIDDVLSETNEEIYLFIFNKDNQVEKILQEGQKDNILEHLEPDAIESFKNFANSLVKIKKDISLKGSQNNENLHYSKVVNPETAKYIILNVNSIEGISKFICDFNNPRYLALPSKNNIRVILVPQDCGDFPYRFYLLTINNNKLIDNLYVEGEWYEPDDEDNKEVTLIFN
jgi:hypothetical protein